MICIILITLNMFNSNYTFFHWFLFFLGEMMSAPPFIATAISLLQFSWVYFALFFNELLSYATFIAVPHSNASSSIFFILHFWGLHLSNVLLDPPWFSFESASLIIIMLSDSFVPLLWPYECDILSFSSSQTNHWSRVWWWHAMDWPLWQFLLCFLLMLTQFSNKLDLITNL